MDISQSIFLKYTLKNTTPEYTQNINMIKNNEAINNSGVASYNNNINIVVKDGEICVENIGSTISDEAWEEIIAKNTPTTPAKSISLSTTYKNFSPAEISNIKQMIYDLHHSSTDNDNDNDNTNNNDDENGTTVKKSFIENFADTETLFEYMNSVNPAITKNTGITREQLITFTQNDDWEDNNYDFFGSINRIFSQLDTDNNDKLTYAEIEAFIEEELGNDFQQYKNKVNTYSEQIQSEYEQLSSQEKLEFAIDKTREYLEASNMTAQIEALDRLLNKTDLYNEIHVGQISIADLNKNNNSGFTTLGAYNYYAWTMEDYDNGVNIGDFAIYSHDDDENNDGADLGITLDISLLDGNWYVLVNTLVHELTHATAYRYYSESTPGAVTLDTINNLFNFGALTEDEKTWYINNWDNICNAEDGSIYEEKLNRLFYLASCAWGEYSAYQDDADYNDSIGQDVYAKNTDNSTTAVDGPNEKETIMEHINTSYNDENSTESIPDYKWWSYA